MTIFVIKYISMNISKNLFDLTEDQEKTSRSIYEGKVIKCLVAPYHTYEQLEKVIPYTKTTLLFPEREMSTTMIKSLISMVVANPSQDEFLIVTTNQNIIMDMIGDCVRVLTEGGDIVYTGTKTFMANIHDIRHELLENDDHRISESERTESQNKIKTIINRVNNKTPITRTDFTQLISEIDLIGEPIIKNKLKEMARDLTIV